jgi:hypothetical protein
MPPDPLSLGFLILEAYFPNRSQFVTLDDLLAFNEQFRYWQRPYEGHEKHYRTFLSECPIGLQAPRRTVGEADLTEIYFNRWASLLTWPVKSDSGKLWSVCPDEWHHQARAWINDPRKHWDSGWIAYADARTYVWTCAILKDGGHTLKEYIPATDQPEELWQYGHWIKLLNVDGPDDSLTMTHQSTPFERQWAKPRTYTRWAHLGALYGFNYHAGALL